MHKEAEMGESDTTVIPSIQIANDVIASIAGLAAAEVDGVAGMAGGVNRRNIRNAGKTRPHQRR